MMNRHDAYTAMLGRHRHVIWAMCRDHAHGQWDDCCDLVQEVSLRLWLEFDRLRPGATPKEEREWVRWVARKVFYLEGRKRRLSTQPLGSEAAAVPASDEEMRLRESVEEMMASLSPEEQRLLRLKMEGYNADEIASVMGLKRDAVYQRMHRIVLKARRALLMVLLLIGTSTVAIAVVPQWRKAVFSSRQPESVPEPEVSPAPHCHGSPSAAVRRPARCGRHRSRSSLPSLRLGASPAGHTPLGRQHSSRRAGEADCATRHHRRREHHPGPQRR